MLSVQSKGPKAKGLTFKMEGKHPSPLSAFESLEKPAFASEVGARTRANIGGARGRANVSDNCTHCTVREVRMKVWWVERGAKMGGMEAMSWLA